MESFLQHSSSSWVATIVDPINNLYLNRTTTEKLQKTAMPLIDSVWLLRNKRLHEDEIGSAKDFGKHFKAKLRARLMMEEVDIIKVKCENGQNVLEGDQDIFIYCDVAVREIFSMAVIIAKTRTGKLRAARPS